MVRLTPGTPSSDNINHLKLSPERNIEFMYNNIKDIVYCSDDVSISNKAKSYLMQFFNGAYGTAKAKFQYIPRNNGTRSFDHLIQVAYSVLFESEKPTLRKVLIAMYHDVIEDTDMSFEWLQQTHGNPEVALGVELISKKPFYDFIEKKQKNGSNYQIFESIKKAGKSHNTGILNTKNILSDDFRHRLQRHDEYLGNFRLTLDEYEKLPKDEREQNIHPDEWIAYEQYIELGEKYKKVRSERYFEKMQDFDTFYTYAQNLIEKHNSKGNNIRLSDEKIHKICMDSFEVKYWDRINNLRTSEIYTNWDKKNLTKAKRKIEETKKYFYSISQETHPYIAKLIKEEVERLEEYISKKEQEKAGSKTNFSVTEILKS